MTYVLGCPKGFTMDCVGFPIHKPIRLLMVTCALSNTVQQMGFAVLKTGSSWLLSFQKMLSSG